MPCWRLRKRRNELSAAATVGMSVVAVTVSSKWLVSFVGSKFYTRWCLARVFVHGFTCRARHRFACGSAQWLTDRLLTTIHPAKASRAAYSFKTDSCEGLWLYHKNAPSSTFVHSSTRSSPHAAIRARCRRHRSHWHCSSNPPPPAAARIASHIGRTERRARRRGQSRGSRRGGSRRSKLWLSGAQLPSRAKCRSTSM